MQAKFPPIAIVGVSGRFPGAPGVEEFWEALATERRLIQDFSEEELRVSGVSDAELADPRYVRSYGWLSGTLQFDAEHFGLSATEAALIDPQHRLFVECAAEALATAGSEIAALGARTGVFAGCLPSAYLLQIVHHAAAASLPELNLELGNHQDFLASRVAWHLGLNGPAVNINAACATSLFAIHAACSALQRGECDLALAGAASVRRFFPTGYRAEPGGVLSADGRCRPFDIAGTGTVFGDGVGCLVLRRAEEARRDGQPIYGVIAASAIGNDGANRPSFAAPAADGQRRVMENAYALLSTNAAARVAFVEAHGTGTLLGDEVELAAMRPVFDVPGRSEPLFVGSAKSNCGHLDAAAGLAGVFKVLGAFATGTMPPTIGVSSPRPDLMQGQLQLSVRSQPSPHLAGVSSFGMGGHSAHLVLAHPEDDVSRTARSPIAWKRKLCAFPGVFAGEERSSWGGTLSLFEPNWKGIDPPPAETQPECLLLLDEETSNRADVREQLVGEGVTSILCAEPPESSTFDPAGWRRLFTESLGTEIRGSPGRFLVDLTPIGVAISTPSADEARRRLARQAGLLQALAEFPVAGLLSLVLDPAQGQPEHGALVALNLAARQERPLLPVSTLELACDLKEALPAVLPRAAHIIRSEPHLRIGSEGWSAQGFVPMRPTGKSAPLVTSQSVCLIVGGTGRIGFALAEALVSAFGCQVIATGSRPESVTRSARKAGRFRQLQTRLLCIEERASVEGVFEEVATRFGRLDLVIHCASCPGEECYQSIEEVSASSLTRVLAPKVDGTINLLAALEKRPDTRLLAISSLAAELAGLSLGAYAAACRYQDALIDFQRERFGRPWVSVNLDHWQLAEDSPEAQRIGVSQGSRIDAESGLAYFRYIFSHGLSGRQLVARTPLPERARKWLRRGVAPKPSAGSAEAVGEKGARLVIGETVRRLVAEYSLDGDIRPDCSLAEMGIDSLAAIELAAVIQAATGSAVSAADLHAAASVESLLARLGSSEPISASLVSVLRSATDPGPSQLTLIHPHGGGLGCYQALVRVLDFQGQVLGIRAQGVFGEAAPLESVEEMAARYLRDLAPHESHARVLLGFSAGGLIAVEMARQLQERGQPPRALVLLDALPPAGLRESMRGETLDEVAFLAEAFLGLVQLPEEELRLLPPEDARRTAIDLWRKAGLVSDRFGPGDLTAWRAVFTAGLKAYITWEVPAVQGVPTLLVRGVKQTGGYVAPEPDLGWRPAVGARLEIFSSPGEHHEILHPPFVDRVAAAVSQFLQTV